MPRWKPETVWEGREVFIIGGGPSLKFFDWDLLHNECTIGCNSAIFLSPAVCKVAIFGDSIWLDKYRTEAEAYTKAGGVLFTNNPRYTKPPSWLWVMERKTVGLYHDALGWNWNTGAAAVNLALLLGAVKVYLLGFDMKLAKNGESNWHDKQVKGVGKDPIAVYHRFQEGFRRVRHDLPLKFPGREVINIHDDNSLDMFPTVSFKKFWGLRKAVA